MVEIDSCIRSTDFNSINYYYCCCIVLFLNMFMSSEDSHSVTEIIHSHLKWQLPVIRSDLKHIMYIHDDIVKGIAG
jgi:hypothetical protein